MKRLTLRQARRKRGLTQEQLSDLTGIDQAAISKLENGKIPHPRFETVITLAEALRTDPRALKFGQPTSSEAA